MKEIVPRKSRGRPKKQFQDADSSTVRALDRGLQLLSLLTKEHRTTLSDLSLRAGVPPSSAYRLLMTLKNHGFAAFDDNTQEWMIGVEAFRTGSAFLKRTNLIENSRQIMRNLMNETGETVNLAIADKGDAVFISQVETQNPVCAFFRPGTRSCMHASGIGKALLAELTQEELEKLLRKKGLPELTPNTLVSPDRLFADLEKIRNRGWAFDDEEHYTGMRCIASAVYNPYGEAVAAISVSGPAVRFTERNINDFGSAVCRAAIALTERMGGRSPDRLRPASRKG